jgi:predicted cupin superfamily sugar epimerase
MLEEVKTLIRELELKDHPEGGYYRETYRAEGLIPDNALPLAMKARRSYSTAIYYLLPEGQRSRFHAMKSDEVWHFYLGGPLELVHISPGGQLERTILGRDLGKKEKLQHAVPAGHWLAAAPLPGGRYSLVGCTVAPGFAFADLTLADPAQLAAQFPRHAELINRLSS